MLPRVGYDHIGTKRRVRTLAAGENMNVDQAIADLEQKEGRKLTTAERREFKRGWRVGGVTFPLNGMLDAVHDLNAEQLDALAADLCDLARKHGINLTE